MYRKKNGRSAAHSTYVRPDHLESMQIAEILSREQGESFSRWITELVHGILQGDATIKWKKTRGKKGRK